MTKLSVMVQCRPRRKLVTLDSCESAYTTVDALRRTTSSCYRCEAGLRRRQALADEGSTIDTAVILSGQYEQDEATESDVW